MVLFVFGGPKPHPIIVFPLCNRWQENKVFAYKSGDQYQLVEGYPKTLQEELGIEGPLDATFVCGESSTLYVIKGKYQSKNYLLYSTE